VHLGSVLVAGSGWTVVPTINPVKGEIAIAISGTTPIAGALEGSLVTIDFHETAAAAGTAARTSIALVSSVNPTGQQVLATELEDWQGSFVLSAGNSVVGLATGTSLEGTAVESPRATVVVTAPLAPTAEDANSRSSAETPTVTVAAVVAPSIEVEVTASMAASEEVTAVHGPGATRGAAPAAVVPLSAIPLPGGLFPIAAGAAPGVPEAAGMLAGQRPADPYFQALGRAASPEVTLVGPVLLPSSGDNSCSLEDDTLSAALRWQSSLETMASRPAQRDRPTVQAAVAPQAADADALDQYFARAASDADPLLAYE
jgi:hypothetical protein